MSENNMQDIRAYLSTPEKPVSMSEFKEFWVSLSDSEKNEYKAADLSK